MNDVRSIDSPALARRAAPYVVVALVAAGLGYLAGGSDGDAEEHVGTAISTEVQIGVEADGWSYNVPLDVRWTDRTGSTHESGRPECLPVSDVPIEGVRFAAVPVEVRGLEYRQVVAVFCS